jgi:glycosyltransferase involved in cell wall biosynthesis
VKLLMFLRDPLPAARVDVAVLFDRELRQRGVHTDYVGRDGASLSPGSAQPSLAVVGRMYATASGPVDALLNELICAWRCSPAYTAVIVRDKPLVGGVILALARLRRVPGAYWMSFPMPLGDRVGAASHLAAGRWARGLVVWIRGWLAEVALRYVTLPLSRHVFVQSQAMRASLSPRISGERVTVVPMGVDTVRLAGQRLDAASGAASRPLTVVYLGSMDRARRLDVLLRAMRRVVDRIPASRLLLIGGAERSDDLECLRAQVAALGLQGAVSHVAPRPMEEAWALAGQATVGVSPIPPGPLFDVSSPTKVVEYLALGLPVVATNIPDQRALIQVCGGGLCVDFDEGELAQALLTVLEAPDHWRALALKAQPQVLKLRNYGDLAEAVRQRLNACLT